MNSKKSLSIIASVAILVIILVTAVAIAGHKKGNNISKEAEIRIAPTNLDTETPMAAPEEVMQAAPVVEGTSRVIDNVVVAPTGKPVKNNVSPGSPEAPQQTALTSTDSLPSGSVNLTGSAEGFQPSTFEVKAGQLVTLSLTSIDETAHALVFDSPELKAITLSAGPGEHRAITFNAPKAGEYPFYCKVPVHTSRGEKGVMIVK